MKNLPKIFSSFRSIFPSLYGEGCRGAAGIRDGVRLFRVGLFRVRLLFMGLFLLPIFSHAEAFVYRHYDLQVQVHPSNTYTCQEKMDLDFSEPRHGIVRDWPLSVDVKRHIADGSGNRVEKIMRYTPVIENFRASEPAERMEDVADFYAMRIGNPDKTIIGPHSYLLNYDYAVGPDRTAIDDVFYFSLLGEGIEANIDSLTFSVTFDKPLPASALKQLRLYYGALGSTNDKAAILSEITPTRLSGTLTAIPPHTALTLHIPLPEGYFNAPEEQQPSSVCWVMLTIAVVLMLLVLIREMKPRNNYVKVVECWPPEGLSSADIGYIYDTQVDPRDVISLIPYFAHKKLLTISTRDGETTFHKLADIPDDAPQYQKTFFNGLFSDGDTFSTSHPSSKYAEAWLATIEGVKKANKGISDGVSAQLFGGVIPCILVLAAMGMLDVTGTGTVLGYIFGMIALMAFITGLSLALVEKATTFLRRLFTGPLFAAGFYFQYVLYQNAAADAEVLIYPTEGYFLAALWLLFAICSVLAYRLRYMSPARLKHIGQIIGFKEFIEKSERDFLASLTKEHEQYFYDILPYAVAFDLLDHWVGQFKDIIVTPPEWYTSDDPSMSAFAGTMATRSLITPAMSHQVQALYEARAQASRSATRSSSIGGFSGGGFGGGGCHSW